MTQRERHGSGTGVTATAKPATAHSALLRPEALAAPGPNRNPSWEDLYQGAAPAQQREILSLAQQQGLLYAHQLAAVANGARPSTPDDRPARQWLSRLLSGNVNDLEPVRPQASGFHDSALDATQREAVARALSTPDICLISGLPGTGKSRVAAEIVTQAAAQGLRVLLLAPSAAAIDRVLLLAGQHEAVCPLRCLDREESSASLPPAIRAFTFPERVRYLTEETLHRAQAGLKEEEERGRRMRQAEAVWPRLEGLAGQYQNLQEQRNDLARQRAGCPEEVERLAAGKNDTLAEAGNATAKTAHAEPAESPGFSLQAAMAVCLRSHQEKAAQLEEAQTEANRQSHECRQELAGRETQLEALRPLAQAKQKGRWWTGAWWRATCRGNVAGQLAELESQQQQTGQALAGLNETVHRLTQERTQAEEAFHEERGRLIQVEIARRQTALEARDAALQQEQELLRKKWPSMCQELDFPAAHPGELTAEAVSGARAIWQRQRDQNEQRVAFAREWISYLQESGQTLANRLPGYVNLVAATLAGLVSDEHFGEHTPLPPFDLLILEEADQVTEAEFWKAAQRARRWVLVGDPGRAGESNGPSKEEAGLELGGPGAVRPPVPLAARLPLPRFGCFHRLWENLHCDPRRLPYTWVQEKERLCCRLRPLSAEQRRCLESEHVADCPEIDLRILVLPRMQPLLAEVVFPASMSIQEAKEYIYRELQELPVQAAGHSLRWIEGPEQLVLHIADSGLANGTSVTLESGIRELVSRRTVVSNGAAGEGTPWQTFRVEFDRQAGWQRAQAEEWVHRHLGVRDLGRTLRLDVPRRMQPPVAAFLSGLLFESKEGYQLPADWRRGLAPGRRAVEFVAVPAPSASPASRRPHETGTGKPENGRRTAGPAQRGPTPKGGAGLEVDLAAGRHSDRLPTELRAGLPSRGFVNYLEAQAVVRKLEALMTDPEVRALCSASHPHGPAIAVLALYQGQAELIRRLVRQSPLLCAWGTAVEVTVPEALRQREAAIVLLSLTRSHVHRAVSFGEEPQALILGLTRARSRLLVFGDQGTLCRRGQWEGPVDHLDVEAAARERKLVAHLVGYLQGHGRYPEVFHLCESSSP
jgi:hypothetical protein